MPAPNVWLNICKTFGSFYTFGRVAAFAGGRRSDETAPRLHLYELGGGWHLTP